jgi:hypothetical protein
MTIDIPKFQCWKCRQDREIEFTHVKDKYGKKIQFCQAKCFAIYNLVMSKIKEEEAKTVSPASSKKYVTFKENL